MHNRGITLKEINKNDFMNRKGLYIISTKSLARRHIYKVGYSGSSLKNRLRQIKDILSPPLAEELIIYGLVIPKTKAKAGKEMNIRAGELRQIEHDVHEAYAEWGKIIKFIDTKKNSEWIREPNLNFLFEALQDVINDEHETYKIHFKLVKF